MSHYEYRVIAAPTRGIKAKGIKSAEARFSNTLEQTMNTLASEGWEYQRAETLPSVERAGFASTTTTWRNVLVFRRLKESSAEISTDTASKPLLSGDTTETQEADDSRAISAPEGPEDDASQSAGASRMLRDNGVEELSDVSGITSSLKQLAKNRRKAKTED